MKDLLEQLQQLDPSPMTGVSYSTGYGDGVHDAIELITEHMKDKVIVPTQLIRDIDDLTEAGFGAENEIDELCALRPAISEGDK